MNGLSGYIDEFDGMGDTTMFHEHLTGENSIRIHGWNDNIQGVNNRRRFYKKINWEKEENVRWSDRVWTIRILQGYDRQKRECWLWEKDENWWDLCTGQMPDESREYWWALWAFGGVNDLRIDGRTDGTKESDIIGNRLDDLFGFIKMNAEGFIRVSVDIHRWIFRSVGTEW